MAQLETWFHSLEQLDVADVREAFQALGHTRAWFPSLSELFLAGLAARSERVDREAAALRRLAPPPRPTVSEVEGRIAEGVTRWRDELLAEVRAQAQAEGWSGEQLREGVAAVHRRGRASFESLAALFPLAGAEDTVQGRTAPREERAFASGLGAPGYVPQTHEDLVRWNADQVTSGHIALAAVDAKIRAAVAREVARREERKS